MYCYGSMKVFNKSSKEILKERFLKRRETRKMRKKKV